MTRRTRRLHILELFESAIQVEMWFHVPLRIFIVTNGHGFDPQILFGRVVSLVMQRVHLRNFQLAQMSSSLCFL